MKYILLILLSTQALAFERKTQVPAGPCSNDLGGFYPGCQVNRASGPTFLVPTGNVGIGSSAPTDALDVIGNIKITTGAISGRVPMVVFSSAPNASEGGVKISTNIVFSTYTFNGNSLNIGDALSVLCVATYTSVNQVKILYPIWQPQDGAITAVGNSGTNSGTDWASEARIKKVSNNILLFIFNRIHGTSATALSDYIFDTSTGTIKLGCMSSSASGSTGMSMDVIYYPAP